MHSFQVGDKVMVHDGLLDTHNLELRVKYTVEAVPCPHMGRGTTGYICVSPGRGLDAQWHYPAATFRKAEIVIHEIPV